MKWLTPSKDVDDSLMEEGKSECFYKLRSLKQTKSLPTEKTPGPEDTTDKFCEIARDYADPHTPTQKTEEHSPARFSEASEDKDISRKRNLRTV